MADKKVIINPSYLEYDTPEVQRLLNEVRDRSFFRDMTEDEYNALTIAEQDNGDLYLLHEEED